MIDGEEYVNLDGLEPAYAQIVLKQPRQSLSTIAADDLNDHRDEVAVQRITNHRLVRGRGITMHRQKYEYKEL